MLNVFLLTYFTKKLNLVIVEEGEKATITSKYGEYLDSIFKEVKIYSCQKDFLSDINKSSFDILLFDNNIHDVKSTFLFIKDVNVINPLIKVILFSKYVDYHILMKCLKYNVSGFMSNMSNLQDLKDFLKVSIKRILMNNNNQFIENRNKFDIKDCLNFLKNEYPVINLVNHYKGIPIIRTAEILDFDEEVIVLKVDSIQLKTIKEEKHAVISSIHLGVEILTSTKSTNYETNEIVLEFTGLIDSYVHHRKNPRVEPIGDSNVIIEDNNNLVVDIMNISIDHVLCSLKELDFNIAIHSYVKIDIDCNFDKKYTNKFKYTIKTKAFIKEILYTNDGKKVLLQFRLNDKDKFILDKYIGNRIKELINELKTKTV